MGQTLSEPVVEKVWKNF